MASGSFWRSKGYAPWFTADTASAAGLALRGLAISLVGYSLSGSTVEAGWLGTLSMVAQQAAGVFGGTFVDRHDRRRLIIINAAVGAVAWGTVAVLLMRGALAFPVLLAVAVAASGVNGFLSSATDAMLRSVIDVHDYPQARSVNEGRDATINMAGSPIGGFLYSVSPWLPFLASACLYALSGASAALIPADAGRPDPGKTDGAGHGTFLHDFLEGWTWTLRRRTLIVTLVAAALLNFGVNGIQYAIQLHLTSTGTNATLIGLVSGGISLMMLLGSLLAARLGGRLPVGKIVCAAFIFICACAIPMTLTDSYPALLAANSLMGLPFPVINAMLLGFIFAKSPTDMQGRITVTLTVPAQTLSSFSSAAAGTLLTILGFRGTVAVFLAFLATAAIIVIQSRQIRAIPKSTEWDHAQL